MALTQAMIQDPVASSARGRSTLAFLALLGVSGCALLAFNQGQAVQKIDSTSLWQSQLGMRSQVAQASANVAATAQASLRARGGRSPLAAQAYMMGVRLAAQDGARVGCRGDLTCARAVGLFFGTQTGKTEECAGKIAAASGCEAKAIDDVSAADLAGFDGLIVGAPTWNTGADEQRSGTTWDDYLEEIKGLDLCGKPVAIFGVGDSAGYGDNFCDAIEELHSTFSSAGAKMLGYVAASDYQHSDSKSVQDDKFLGLPLDEDNEYDMTDDRVKKWVDQIKSEGMPLDQ